MKKFWKAIRKKEYKDTQTKNGRVKSPISAPAENRFRDEGIETPMVDSGQDEDIIERRRSGQSKDPDGSTSNPNG